MNRAEKVLAAQRLYASDFHMTIREVASELGVSRSTAFRYIHDTGPRPRKKRAPRWPRERVVEAIQGFALELGRPPAEDDWNPTNARRNGDEPRARRFEERNARGEWPGSLTVCRVFGSWTAAIAAAGFEPQPQHNTVGRQQRIRAERAAAPSRPCG